MAASDFFSRWAKPATVPDVVSPAPAQVPPESAEGEPLPAAAPTAPPTLEQARHLTPQDDFRAFVRPDVAPEVRNTAMRQLFRDPHFNVMDGLDIYIDDYNTPDPLPEGYLARMVSAQAMRLLKSDDEPQPQPPGKPQAGVRQGLVEPEPEQHRDDPDLRLQPNPEPGPDGHGSGPD